MKENTPTLTKKTISIDCGPGTRRPNHYAEYIFKNILKRPYQEDNSRFFGCWTWEGVEMTEEESNKAFEYLKKEYHAGNIRYAGID